MADSGFFQQVWDIVARVPAGKVVSYGQIAAWLGSPRAARTVGWAMATAPRRLGLPCHRVVTSSGRLVPGWETQRDELEVDGVTFKANGCVDMARHQWDGKRGSKPGASRRKRAV
ncbi:MAG: MGMT family protein [Bacillota bacterium]